MSESWIADASPLVFLSRIGGWSWLGDLAGGGIRVPAAVLAELAAGPAGVGLALDLRQQSWVVVVADIAVPAGLKRRRLGEGETQVIAHAMASPPARALLDDRPARSSAKAYGVAVVGTLGLLVAAKRRGLVSSVGPQIQRLQSTGMYLTPALVSQMLGEAGEPLA